MFWKMFFERKKMYKIVYRQLAEYTTIIEARNEFQAIRKFHRMHEYSGITPSIVSFERYWID